MHKPSEWDTRQGQTPDTLPPVTLQPGLSELGHPLSRPGHPQPGRWGLAEPRHGGGVGGCPTQFGERPVSPGCWEDQVTSEVVCEMRYKERGMSSRCTGCTCHGAPAVAGRGEHEGMCAAREPTGVKAESPPGPDPGTVSSSAHPHPPPSPGLPGSPSESHPNPARRGSPGQWVSVLCPPCRQPGQRESCPARSHGGGARHPADMGAGLRLSPLGHHCQGSLLGFGPPGGKDKKGHMPPATWRHPRTRGNTVTQNSGARGPRGHSAGRVGRTDTTACWDPRTRGGHAAEGALAGLAQAGSHQYETPLDWQETHLPRNLPVFKLINALQS